MQSSAKSANHFSMRVVKATLYLDGCTQVSNNVSTVKLGMWILAEDLKLLGQVTLRRYLKGC